MARTPWILALVAIAVRLLLLSSSEPFGESMSGLGQMLGTSLHCIQGTNPWCKGIKYTLTNLWIVRSELFSPFTETADDIAAKYLAVGKNSSTHSHEHLNLALSDKVAIVTGGSSGIGLETTRVLLEYGCHVILAVRNVTKGQEVLDGLVLQTSSNTHQTHPGKVLNGTVLELDLSDLDSVEEFAKKIQDMDIPVHYLINNGGIMTLPTEVRSKQGYELQFATNYLGHFYLTKLLEPMLKQSGTVDKPSRVIFLTSTVHHLYELHEHSETDEASESSTVKAALSQDIPPSKEYHFLFNYALSKMLTLVAASEFQRQWGSNGSVVAAAVHPGIATTNLGHENRRIQSLFFMFLRFEHKSIRQAASTTIYTLLAPEVIHQVREEGRFYFENNRVAKLNRERPSLYSKEFREEVWKLTNELLDKHNTSSSEE